ncbi:MAG TPA: transposase family protein [Verrucomicrobiae bacterium]|nr:transposase family protein [Verrucomicrobiae bacterium]
MQEFDDLYKKELSKKYSKHEIKRLSKRKNRERSTGAGRPFKLDVRDRLLMLLVYYRLYITYTLAGFLFDLDQSNICRDIQKIESLIRQCLPIPQKIYNITKRLRTPDEVGHYFPSFLAFIDSTEQEIPRPKNKRKRKAYYSGKKKRHTVKSQIMVNNHGIIIHKTCYKKGKRHDYNIYKNNHPVTPKQVVNVFDLGYLGIEKDFPEQLSSIPNRKKRNMDLSVEEREYNKSHSKKRIVIEHTICRLKKFRILADVFRNRLRKYNKVSDIVAGLVNYGIMNRNN